MNKISLQQMKKIDIRTVDPKKLVDIREVEIDAELPTLERLKTYISQIGNPYCFACNGVAVQLDFADTEITLEERVAGIVSKKYA
jgi:hypothetical protein